MHRMKTEKMMTEQETEKQKIRTAAEKNIQKLQDQLNDANFKIKALLQENVMNSLYLFCWNFNGYHYFIPKWGN